MAQAEQDRTSGDRPRNSTRDAYRRFVGPNARYYLRVWSRLQRRDPKWSWNWAAFLFCPWWFFYRKMYGYGAVLLLTLSCLPLVAELAERPQYNGFALGVVIGSGLIGNWWYFQHTRKQVRAIAREYPDERERIMELRAQGRTSPLAAWVTFTTFVVVLGLYEVGMQQLTSRGSVWPEIATGQPPVSSERTSKPDTLELPRCGSADVNVSLFELLGQHRYRIDAYHDVHETDYRPIPEARWCAGQVDLFAQGQSVICDLTYSIAWDDPAAGLFAINYETSNCQARTASVGPSRDRAPNPSRRATTALSPTDVLIDPKRYLGRQVSVHGVFSCFGGACSVSESQATTTGIHFEIGALGSDAKRTLLSVCAEFTTDPCRGVVSGRIERRFLQEIKLTATDIAFQ